MDKYEIGIVGGSGFVGSSLARHLSDTFKVSIFDKSPVPNDLRGRVDFQQCDIRNYNEVKKKIKDVALLIHTAIVQIPLINENRRLGYEVNLLGTQNVCEVANENKSIRGVILAGSWHVFGERDFRVIVTEEFGFRPDKIEKRAKYYALTKMAQETIVRIYDEMSEKIFGIIRMGTVLGEGMPEETAASIFITKGLKGEAITPYKHSMYRPILYVDIKDVCRGFNDFAKKILDDELSGETDSFAHIFNLVWPEPVTILDLATIVRDDIITQSKGEIRPEIKVVDKGLPSLHTVKDKEALIVDVKRFERFLGYRKLTSPRDSIERLVAKRLAVWRARAQSEVLMR